MTGIRDIDVMVSDKLAADSTLRHAKLAYGFHLPEKEESTSRRRRGSMSQALDSLGGGSTRRLASLGGSVSTDDSSTVHRSNKPSRRGSNSGQSIASNDVAVANADLGYGDHTGSSNSSKEGNSRRRGSLGGGNRNTERPSNKDNCEGGSRRRGSLGKRTNERRRGSLGQSRKDPSDHSPRSRSDENVDKSSHRRRGSLGRKSPGDADLNQLENSSRKKDTDRSNHGTHQTRRGSLGHGDSQGHSPGEQRNRRRGSLGRHSSKPNSEIDSSHHKNGSRHLRESELGYEPIDRNDRCNSDTTGTRRRGSLGRNSQGDSNLCRQGSVDAGNRRRGSLGQRRGSSKDLEATIDEEALGYGKDHAQDDDRNSSGRRRGSLSNQSNHADNRPRRRGSAGFGTHEVVKRRGSISSVQNSESESNKKASSDTKKPSLDTKKPSSEPKNKNSGLRNIRHRQNNVNQAVLARQIIQMDSERNLTERLEYEEMVLNTPPALGRPQSWGDDDTSLFDEMSMNTPNQMQPWQKRRNSIGTFS